MLSATNRDVVDDILVSNGCGLMPIDIIDHIISYLFDNRGYSGRHYSEFYANNKKANIRVQTELKSLFETFWWSDYPIKTGEYVSYYMRMECITCHSKPQTCRDCGLYRAKNIHNFRPLLIERRDNRQIWEKMSVKHVRAVIEMRCLRQQQEKMEELKKDNHHLRLW